MQALSSFFLGILAAGLALTAEAAVSVFSTSIFLEASFVSARLPLFFLLISAFVEELAKYLLIWKNSQNITQRQKIISQALLIGLGFAASEIFFYFLGLGKKLDIFSLPYWGLFFIHSSTALIAGYWISKQAENKGKFLKFPLIANTLIHLLYNLIWFYF